MYKLCVLALLASVACAAVLRESDVSRHVQKYDLLVDIAMARAETECTTQEFNQLNSKPVFKRSGPPLPPGSSQLDKRASKSRNGRTQLAEPELQLEHLKSLYSHYLSLTSACIRARPTTPKPTTPTPTTST